MKVTIWIVLIGLCGSALAADYYVATNGSDVAAGNIGAPFATIQYAADQMSAGDSCTIRGGRYPEEITVSNKDDLTFAAYSNETVVIDGSTVITNSWTQHAGNIYKTTLTEDVWQLFADGEMMIPARWPNADPNTDFWEQWESDHWAEGRAERNYGPDNPPWDTNGTMYDKPHSGIDLAASGLNLSNAVVVLNVGSFRTGTSIVDWHVPGTNKFTYPPITTGFKDKEHYYFVEGKLELLDAENEWFFDVATSNLYVWVPGGGSPAGLEIKGKTTTYCLTATDCDDLTVSGIDFFSGTFNLDGCLRARVEHGELTYPSTTKRMLRIIETPQTTKVNSDFAEVYNCTFAYTDGHGINVGGDDATVENCYFHHIDYSCANLPSVMPALYIGGSRVTFRHNTLHSFGASVGLLQGNAGTTEYNNFYNGGYKQHDGAMVQVMVAKQTNADIGWNWVHDWSRLGIRFDGSGGGAGGVGGLVHHSVGWGVNMNSTVFIGNHENNEIISNSGIYSKSRPEIVVESANNSNTNTITRNNFARQIAGTTTDGSAVPGVVDHNWDGYDLGLDIRTQVRDPDNLDFRPLPGADIVDAGTNYPGVTDGYVGDAPDIGAYEYGDSTYWIAGHQAATASIPIPPVGTTDAKGSASLMWQPALGTLSNNVYLGTSSNAVANGTTLSPEFKGNTENNIYNPLGLYAQTYYWRIDSITPSGTVTGEVWSFAASGVSATPPGTINTAAAEITEDSAVVGGQITDGATASRVWMHWWADGGATNTVDMGVQDYSFELPLSGLLAGTLYHYQCQASNTYGTSWAPVSSFTTEAGAVPPQVANTAASNISSNSATIGGQITLSEADAAWIHWWADGGPTNVIDVGAQTGTFSTNLTGLDADTLHYFQCRAANIYGTNWAASAASFTTLDGSVETNGLLLAYEGFEYEAGTKIHGLDGGAGFSGAWVSSQGGTATDEHFEVVSGGDSWGDLPVSSNRLERISTGGTEAISRTLSADLDATNLWFSVLWRPRSNEGFAIGSGALQKNGGPPDTIAGGAGFGFINTDNTTAYASIFHSSGRTNSASGLAIAQDTPILLAGHIEFNVDTSGVDRVTLYPVTTNLTLGTPVSVERDVDETLLNMLTIESNRGPGYDEIRIGRSFEDVISDGTISPTVPPYESWGLEYGLTGSETNYLAHSDADGLNQLLEYGLGGNPTNNDASSILPMFGESSGGGSASMEYIYRRRTDWEVRELNYWLELNTNLVSGTWNTNGYTEVGAGPLEPGFEAVTNRISTESETNRFIRLRIRIN